MYELCTIVTRAMNTLTSSQKKVWTKSNKGDLEVNATVSEEKEGTLSASATPVKYIAKKGKRAEKKQKSVQFDEIHED